MDISVITYFNIVVVTVSYELPSYPFRRVVIFVSSSAFVDVFLNKRL